MANETPGGAPGMGARRSFAAALVAARRAGIVPVVPDVKVRSPKEGDLLGARDPVAYARALAAAGAPAVSVVTEPEHFGGSLAMLEAIAAAVPVPVLRKDFIQTEEALAASREAGAAAVLLIAVHLPPERLARLVEAAHRLGLETVVEVHDETELERALALPLDVLGVNNRDIANLERDQGDVRTSASLAARIPSGITWMSESGIRTPAEVRYAAELGATAVLVGTEILQAPDPVRRWRELSVAAPERLR